ncbi:kinase-like domain-containing protein [Mycena sp. CBHHK59/15]|nr:kinase-like domain-containing protein [Mycena sp. CBHHK59/15]
MRNDFVFCDQDGFEESARYGPGGLCPVKLGDTLGPDCSSTPPRYRVTAKLGYGAYSTVWLARDLVARKTVALKFVEASQTPESKESAILERLRAPSSAPPKSPPPVLQLRDSFRLRSANGAHEVLVTEPVILLQRLLKLPGLRTSTRGLVRQAVEGLAFIHGRGIAHGGEPCVLITLLSAPNLGVAIPELDTFSETDIWEWCGPPEVMPLVAYDPARDLASFPPYLSQAVDLGPFLLANAPGFAEREPRVRILDLGNAYVAEDSPSPRCNTPIAYAAPEVIFPLVVHNDKDGQWDRHTDIWSLASTIHEIAGGSRLFSGYGLGAPLLGAMASLCGGAPEAWRQYLATVPDAGPRTDYNTELADELWKEREERFRKQGEEDAPGLVKLLRRMLVIDPKRRASASELLQDPYLAL